VHELSDFWPFFAAFAALVAAGFGAPIPEELPTIGAGIWVASNPDFGPLRWLILPVCFAGVLISDVLLYGIGRLWGPRLLSRPWVARFMPPETRDKIEHNYQSYGTKVLLLVRWVPGIRSPMFITAGVMRLPLSRFVLADGAAAVFGHTMLFMLAYWFGDQVRALVMAAEKEVADRLTPLLVLSAIVAVTAYFVLHYLRRPVTTGDPTEVPLIGEQVAAKIDAAKSEAAGERTEACG
jgi:membrane protein DedA with SNARE-associated domain